MSIVLFCSVEVHDIFKCFLYCHLFVFIKTLNHSVSAILFTCWGKNCQTSLLSTSMYWIFVIATKIDTVSLIYKVFMWVIFPTSLTWHKAKRWNWTKFQPDWITNLGGKERVSAIDGFNWLCPHISSLTDELFEKSKARKVLVSQKCIIIKL